MTRFTPLKSDEPHVSEISRIGQAGDHPEQHTDFVGRPGLDPGTLGLKVPCSSG